MRNVSKDSPCLNQVWYAHHLSHLVSPRLNVSQPHVCAIECVGWCVVCHVSETVWHYTAESRTFPPMIHSSSCSSCSVAIAAVLSDDRTALFRWTGGPLSLWTDSRNRSEMGVRWSHQWL